MKQLTFILIMVTGLAFAFPALAREKEAPVDDESGEFPNFRVGAGAYFGAAWGIGDYDEVDAGGSKPRFAGGGAILGDMYLMDILAVTLGIGLQGQGYILKEEGGGGNGDTKVRFIYLDVPIGAKLDFSNLQIGLALAINFAFSGKAKTDVEQWEIDWKIHKRFNLAPKVTVGYAIPLGPVYLVPSIDFSIQMLNNAGDDAMYDSERNMNIMAGISGYYGLPF
jgi:hypothetical protein